MCCGGTIPTANKEDCDAASTGVCADASAANTDSVILKMIANSNAISLDDVDDTGSDVYKGVELYPGASGTSGMFGMYEEGADNTTLCLATKAAAAGERICSTYSNYVTFTEAESASDSKKYLYN